MRGKKTSQSCNFTNLRDILKIFMGWVNFGTDCRRKNYFSTGVPNSGVFPILGGFQRAPPNFGRITAKIEKVTYPRRS